MLKQIWIKNFNVVLLEGQKVTVSNPMNKATFKFNTPQEAYVFAYMRYKEIELLQR